MSASVGVWLGALGRLVGAGVPLTAALERLEPVAPAGLRAATRTARQGVTSGRTLGESLEAAPRAVSRGLSALLTSAERAGTLPVALGAAGDVLLAETRGRRGLARQVAYLALVALGLLLVSSVKQNSDIHAAAGVPFFALDGVAATALEQVGETLFVALIALGALHISVSRRPLSAPIDRAKLLVPLLGPSLRLGLLTPAMAIMAAHLQAGGTEAVAWRLAAGAVPNTWLARRLASRADSPIDADTRDDQLFRPLERLVLVSSRRRGQLDVGAARLSAAMAARLERRSVAVARILVPLLVVYAGALIMARMSIVDQ